MPAPSKIPRTPQKELDVYTRATISALRKADDSWSQIKARTGV